MDLISELDWSVETKETISPGCRGVYNPVPLVFVVAVIMVN